MLVHAVLASFCVCLVSASVLCPDGNTCAEKNTCCLTSTGYYGCCVYPFAVCCPDLLHCCPTGYHCEEDTHTCVKQGLPWLRLQWSKNTPVKKETSQTGTAPQLSLPKPDNSIAVRESSAILKKPSGVGVDVVHCDNYHACPDGYTCCRSVYTWAWGCCPHILGQCCADGFHCCPQGTTCDLFTFRCLSGSASIPASPQIPALRTDYQEPCCLNGDEAGCCQVGFHCDRERRVCVADSAPLDIWTTLEEQGLEQGLESPGGGAVALRGVIRCDGRFYCPADHSCCRTPTGEWGCCPYRLGVCCTDGRHCCDYHMTCDESSLSCNQGENSIPSASMGQILRI